MTVLHKLSKIKDLPKYSVDPEWFSVSKAHLMAELRVKKQERAFYQLTMFEKFRMFMLKATRKLVPSPVKVGSLAVLLIFASSTAVIAQAAVPGEFLWPVKLSMEKAELILTNDPVSEAEISIKHANKRLKELEVLVSKDLDIAAKQQAISQVIRQLEKNMVAADSSLKLAQSGSSDKNRTVGLARNLSRSANSTAKVLKQQAKDIAGVVIVDGKVISSAPEENNNLFVTVKVNKNSGIDLEQELKDSVAQQESVVVALTEVIETNKDMADKALNTILKTDDEEQAISDADLQELVEQQIIDQEADLTDVQAVVASINSNDIIKKILNGEEDRVTIADVNGLKINPKNSATILEQAKVLLAEGKVLEAKTKVEDSKVILDKTVEVLSRLGAEVAEDKASVEADVVTPPVTKPVEVTIQTVHNELLASSSSSQVVK